MRHTFVIETRRRRAIGGPDRVRSASEGGLFRNAHAGRYFGGLWFKVFSERGPCQG